MILARDGGPDQRVRIVAWNANQGVARKVAPLLARNPALLNADITPVANPHFRQEIIVALYAPNPETTDAVGNGCPTESSGRSTCNY